MRFFSKPNLLKKLRVKKHTAFCLPAFYIDPVGCKTQAEAVEAAFPLLREYLIACRADPFFGVYISDVDVLKPYLDLYPEERAWISRLIQQERCSTGGAYNQPNETTVGGEALIRNILIGQTYHRTILGSETPVFMTWNAYGHIPQLPQILYQCGIVAAIFRHSNIFDEKKPIPGLPGLFLWTAPNGSWIYARRMPTEIKVETNLLETASKLILEHQKLYPDVNSELLIDAGTGTRPRTRIVGNCRDLSEGEPSLILTGAAGAKYFSCIETLFNKEQIQLEPVTRDMTQCCEAGALTRMDLKIANRLTENMVYEAELWGTLTIGLGIPYPSSRLDKAWRQLLFSQHHNAITGFVNELSFLDLLESYREALEIAEQERRKTLTALASIISTPSDEESNVSIVFNSLPWLRDGIVRDWVKVNKEITPHKLISHNGTIIPYEIEQLRYDLDGVVSQAMAVWVHKDIPAAGYESLLFKKSDDIPIPYLRDSLSQTWVENDFFRIEIEPDRGGGIISLFDKINNKEFINPRHPQPANDVMALAESPEEFSEAFLSTSKDRLLSSAYRAEVKYMEGPVSQRLFIRGKGPGPCSRIQEIRLYNELPYIDCFTVLENYQGYGRKKTRKETESFRDLYVTGFPLDLPGTLPVLEDKFYSRSFMRSQKSLEFISNRTENISQHGLNSCYRWVDISWSLLIRFLEGKQIKFCLAVGPSEIVYGQDQHRSCMEHMILYLAQHSVTCTPRRDSEDVSTDLMNRHVSFSIGAIEENLYTGKLLETNPHAIEFYRRTLEEIGYVVMSVPDRFSNPNREPRPAFIFAGKNPALTKSAIDEMIQSTSSHRWDSPVASCFLENLSPVEDVGFAVLNRGNTLCSLEADGTLCLAMMHTVPYVSPHTPWTFDFAEGKTSVFQYRLIPHQGDWRFAEIPRRAMEYNHEPFALSETSHRGSLPPKLSFLSVEPRNILVSAIKPSGFPEAEYRNPAPQYSSIISRFYEAHGEQSNIWLESYYPIRSVKPVSIDEKPSRTKREIFREEQYIRAVAQAHEIVTFQVDCKYPSTAVYKPAESEIVPPRIVPSRYWRYNLGAASEGFLPVSVSIRGYSKIQTNARETIYHLDLIIVNNSPGESRSGEMDIITPFYWRAIPSHFSYRVQEGSYQIIPFHLLIEEPGREGFIKARTKVNGQIVEDVVHIGKPPEFDLAMTLTRDGFNVKLKHEYPFEISGFLSLITPVESWPGQLAGEFSISSVAPGKQDFSIPPHGKITLSFPLTELENYFNTPSDRFWIVIKLAAHNTIRYYHVRLDGRPSEGLGQILFPPYENLPHPGF